MKMVMLENERKEVALMLVRTKAKVWGSHRTAGQRKPSPHGLLRLPGWAWILFLAGAGLLPAALLRSSPQNVVVTPQDNLQSLVNSHPPGTSFTLSAGIYRLQSVVPKDGDSFSGEPGAVMNGAELLTSFTHQGKFWIAKTQAQEQAQYRGKCDDDRPACIYPEDLFVDDSPLKRVSSLSEVTPGKWYLDYSSGEAYLANDPAGHKVEISVVPHSFSGAVRNVTIQGLTIEKYACAAGEGAIDARSPSGPAPGRNWIVQNNVIQLNHGVGVWAGPGTEILHNKVLHNGQMGLAGSGTNLLVDGNEIAFNNYAGYDFGWEAGGTKFVFTTDLVVRNNFSHDNKGPGLWTDIENRGALFEKNHTERNKEAGILHEISYQAVIRNNVIEDDGFSDSPSRTSPWYGAGIIIAGSSDVEVYGNTVTDCMNGIVGTYPRRELSPSGTPYLLRNLYVYDNIIIQDMGIAAGIVRAGALSDDVFTSWNNRFAHNTFHLANSQGLSFAWMNVLLPISRWRQDFHEN